jgi:hypothetical protein
MATHDALAGTGGLDGSIGVEANRPEVSSYEPSMAVIINRGLPKNAGTAINTTIVFFMAFVSPNLSCEFAWIAIIVPCASDYNQTVADFLAMGARTAMDACGGPEFGYRAGRVDNFIPGPFGVPEPQQDLQSHISAFSRMGFTQEEMIGLVACGHSIGGVHHASFPGTNHSESLNLRNAHDICRHRTSSCKSCHQYTRCTALRLYF